MTLFYFGFTPRNRGTTKLAVKTTAGELEPTEPSRFTVYVHRVYHPLYSLVSSILGLLVAIVSFPVGYYVHLSAPGLMTRPAGDAVLPFRTPGLAIVLRKGRRFSTDVTSRLEEAGFSSMEFSGRSIWVKENASKDDFLIASSEGDVDPTGPHPARFCNTDSFRAYLVLRSFTTRICELFHFLSSEGSPYAISLQKKHSLLKKPYIHARDDTPADVAMEGTFPGPEFDKPIAVQAGDNDRRFQSLLRCVSGSNGLVTTSSGVLTSLPETWNGFLTSGVTTGITSHGIICKFHPQLALPDANLIGDVLGRRFLAGLGEDLEEQTENLDLLKSGLSSLRLTRLGDELTHLYRCLDLAIECNAGCVPIFTRNVYEGCLISGGPGATLIHNGAKFPFLSISSLKQDMLNVSTHATALGHIAAVLPETMVEAIKECRSMVDLRKLCLAAQVTQQERELVIRHAANLEYSTDDLVINPANLKRCFTILSNLSLLTPNDPIGRMALFETDPVVVALSMFGEKTAPSWDIPNGTPCSLKKGSPPAPPTEQRKKGSRGEVSDAAWVMVIRQTDLFSAAEEFRKMASTLVYRSSSSVLAKKVGHRVFGRDRVGEFWTQMREALRTINPNAEYEDAGVASKRNASDSPSTVVEGEPTSKRRRMDF